MVKVVRKAVGMTPVADLTREAAAHHLVAHVPVDQTVRPTVIKNRSTAEDVARAAQIDPPTVIGNRSLAETAGKEVIARNASPLVEMAGQIGQHTATESRSLAETAAMTARHTVIGSHSVAETVGMIARNVSPLIEMVDRTAQRMVTENRLAAMADHAMADHAMVDQIGQHMEIENHLLAETAATTAQPTVIGSPSLVETAGMIGRNANPSIEMATVRNASHSPTEPAATNGPPVHAKGIVPVLIAATGTKVLTNARNGNPSTGTNARKAVPIAPSSVSHSRAEIAATGMKTAAMTAPVSTVGTKAANVQNAPNGNNSSPATPMPRPVHALRAAETPDPTDHANHLPAETATVGMMTGPPRETTKR